MIVISGTFIILLLAINIYNSYMFFTDNEEDRKNSLPLFLTSLGVSLFTFVVVFINKHNLKNLFTPAKELTTKQNILESIKRLASENPEIISSLLTKLAVM
jgi:hypothetical protein